MTALATRAGVDRRAMVTLSAGHLFTDLAQGAVPALLPFLIVRDHLSYAAASALVLAATISSSVIQPLFGHLSDRLSLAWLMPLGPTLGGVGVALAGFTQTYALTFAAMGIYALVVQRRWQFGLVVAAVCTAWFALVLDVVIPAISGRSS